jgi:hypothetical protein
MTSSCGPNGAGDSALYLKIFEENKTTPCQNRSIDCAKKFL